MSNYHVSLSNGMCYDQVACDILNYNVTQSSIITKITPYPYSSSSPIHTLLPNSPSPSPLAASTGTTMYEQMASYLVLAVITVVFAKICLTVSNAVNERRSNDIIGRHGGTPDGVSEPTTSGTPGYGCDPTTGCTPGGVSTPTTSGSPGGVSAPTTGGTRGGVSEPTTSGTRGGVCEPITGGTPGGACNPTTSGTPGCTTTGKAAPTTARAPKTGDPITNGGYERIIIGTHNTNTRGAYDRYTSGPYGRYHGAVYEPYHTSGVCERVLTSRALILTLYAILGVSISAYVYLYVLVD